MAFLIHKIIKITFKKNFINAVECIKKFADISRIFLFTILNLVVFSKPGLPALASYNGGRAGSSLARTIRD